MLQAKGKERQWIKHQMYGDLDEAKLIEGLTGEKGIYKRRGEKEPEVWTLDCYVIKTLCVFPLCFSVILFIALENVAIAAILTKIIGIFINGIKYLVKINKFALLYDYNWEFVDEILQSELLLELQKSRFTINNN